MKNVEIENLELKYLKKYYYFLKFAIDEILLGLKTKDTIKNDWKGLWGAEISNFSTGAERVVYSLLNGKGVGVPNSNPVGSDLFFELDDAFIHIDLKTVGTNNIGDFATNIFVGTNQNSYKHHMLIYEGKKNQYKRDYTPHLPTIYNKGKKNQKLCLTYFITILYDSKSADALVVNIMCMPNGLLSKIYKHRPLKAGKNIEKTRFNFIKAQDFELLENEKRIRVVYFKKGISREFKQLTFQEDIYNKMSD